MRCDDVTLVWADLRDRLERSGVLVLPQLTGARLVARLDDEVELMRVVQRCDVPAVYVWSDGDSGRGAPSVITVSVVAGGVVHRLYLTSDRHAELAHLAPG